MQNISRATLFAPVTRVEAVRAMSEFSPTSYSLIFVPIVFQVLVAGWSDNGWLSGGHAVRMAMELCEQFWLLQRFRSHLSFISTA